MSSFRIETNKRSLGFPETIEWEDELKLTIEKGLDLADFIGLVGDFTLSQMGITAHTLATVSNAMRATLFTDPMIAVAFNAKDTSGVHDIQFYYNPANGRVIFANSLGDENITNWLFPEEEE